MTYDELEEQILEIARSAWLMPNGDLQGVIEALVNKVKTEGLIDIKLKEL